MVTEGPASSTVRGFDSSTVRAVTSLVMLAMGRGFSDPLAASTPGKPTAPIALAPYPGHFGAAASPGSSLCTGTTGSA
jgi:hypothetical protein